MDPSSLSLKTISDLRVCYDNHAKKFSSTRKKIRPEMQYIIEHIASLYQGKPLHIVELGCGDGRILKELTQQHPTYIASYVGVDISDQLLNIAKQQNKSQIKIKRINNDMISYLFDQRTESIDIIITMASYQHLPDQKSRNQFMTQVYRTLTYGGQRISIDRSRSWWMIQTHYHSLLQSIKKYIITFGNRSWNNLLIPFTDQGKTHWRLYHIQTICEIKKIIYKHGLQCKERYYSSQDGSFHHNIIYARNICCIAEKTIFHLKK